MYHPSRFSAIYETENGKSIWAFLWEEDNIVRMETATYLWRPAVEPLSPFLLARFGATIKRRQMKQMIGHMVRQVMERRGFHLQQSNVRIARAGNIFSRASRYARLQGRFDGA